MKKLFKYIFVLFTFLILIAYVNAEEYQKFGDDSEGYIRSSENNYGVKKGWNIDADNLDNVLRTPYVNSDIKIHDFAGIYTEEEKIELESYIKDFITNTKMDMVILTVNYPYTYDGQNEDVAADFYDYNDFGMEFEKNSGVLLLRNAWETDPYFNVYTFGNAQLYYSYERCETMLDMIYPSFKSHSYFDGTKMFIDIFNNYYFEGVSTDDYEVDDMGYLVKVYNPPYAIAAIISAVGTLIIMLIMGKKNKMVRKSDDASMYYSESKSKLNVKNDKLEFTHTSRRYIPPVETSTGGGHSGGGFSSHSGSSGGGHSSGGGRHG